MTNITNGFIISASGINTELVKGFGIINSNVYDFAGAYALFESLTKMNSSIIHITDNDSAMFKKAASKVMENNSNVEIYVFSSNMYNALIKKAAVYRCRCFTASEAAAKLEVCLA